MTNSKATYGVTESIPDKPTVPKKVEPVSDEPAPPKEEGFTDPDLYPGMALGYLLSKNKDEVTVVIATIAKELKLTEAQVTESMLELVSLGKVGIQIVKATFTVRRLG